MGYDFEPVLKGAAQIGVALFIAGVIDGSIGSGNLMSATMLGIGGAIMLFLSGIRRKQK